MTAVLVFPVSVMTTRPSSVLALLGPRHSKNTWTNMSMNMNNEYFSSHGIYRKSPVNKFRKSKLRIKFLAFSTCRGSTLDSGFFAQLS